MGFADDITPELNRFESALCDDDGRDLSEMTETLMSDATYRKRFVVSFLALCMARRETLRAAAPTFIQLLDLWTDRAPSQIQRFAQDLALYGLVDWAREAHQRGIPLADGDGEPAITAAAALKRLAYIDFCVQELGQDPRIALDNGKDLDGDVKRRLLDHSRRLASTTATAHVIPRKRLRPPGL